MTRLQQDLRVNSWHRRYGCPVAVTLVSLAGLSPPVIAQELPAGSVVDVSGVPTCQTCEIQFSHVVRLGSTDGKDAMWSTPIGVFRIGDDYILVSESDGGRLLLYDTDGNILDAFDKRGGGPEEVESLGVMARLGPTTVANIDWGNGRFSILEAGSGKVDVARTVRITDELPGQVFPFDESSVIGVDTYAGWAKVHQGQPSRSTTLASQRPVSKHRSMMLCRPRGFPRGNAAGLSGLMRTISGLPAKGNT